MRRRISALLITGLAVAAVGTSANVAVAKNGADDPAGHVRHGHGADDARAHKHHAKGGADDSARHGRHHGGNDDGPNHQ
jgi:hypothetical protein